jgi:hypothetical protein
VRALTGRWGYYSPDKGLGDFLDPAAMNHDRTAIDKQPFKIRECFGHNTMACVKLLSLKSFNVHRALFKFVVKFDNYCVANFNIPEAAKNLHCRGLSLWLCAVSMI